MQFTLKKANREKGLKETASRKLLLFWGNFRAKKEKFISANKSDNSSHYNNPEATFKYLSKAG